MHIKMLIHIFVILSAHRIHSGVPGPHDRFHCVWDVWAGGHTLRNTVFQDRRRKLRSEGEDCCDWRSVLSDAG